MWRTTSNTQGTLCTTIANHKHQKRKVRNNKALSKLTLWFTFTTQQTMLCQGEYSANNYTRHCYQQSESLQASCDIEFGYPIWYSTHCSRFQCIASSRIPDLCISCHYIQWRSESIHHIPCHHWCFVKGDLPCGWKCTVATCYHYHQKGKWYAYSQLFNHELFNAHSISTNTMGTIHIRWQ